MISQKLVVLSTEKPAMLITSNHLLPDGDLHSRSLHMSVHTLSSRCVRVHTQTQAPVCVCVCVAAQLKVNSLRLTESTLKSGDCGDFGDGRERGGRPIPDRAPRCLMLRSAGTKGGVFILALCSSPGSFSEHQRCRGMLRLHFIFILFIY